MRLLLILTCAFGLLGFQSPTQAPSSASPDFTVTVFMAPKCTICKYYTPALKELHAHFSGKGVAFQGVFPNAHSTLESIDAFKQEFSIPFSLVQDSADLASQFDATVTPEVVLTNAKGEVLYQGRIDNSYVRVGKRRTYTSSSELKDALKAVTSGKEVKVKSAPPIGCIIEKRK